MILEINKSYKFIYLLRFYSRCVCMKSHSGLNNNSFSGQRCHLLGSFAESSYKM